ncbi:MAG: VOC family protein [Erysipelotrichaceae bacterium]|jgi:catechol 2,3-dioxygenase-like lactoylglutathione lyase family enzyme|nr:VOC family protein [Erysipelotrichaceae bacterium]
MKLKLKTVVVDCPDAHECAAFYSGLLDWPIFYQEADFVLLRDPQGGTGLSFQSEEDYVAPVWPEEPGKPQKGLHLDFLVDDLAAGEMRVLELGGIKAETQFLLKEGVVVFFDPAGHPFCLFEDNTYDWD